METVKQNCNVVLLKAENIKKRENEMNKIHSIYKTKSRTHGVSHSVSNMESKENTRYLKYSPLHRNQDVLLGNDKNEIYVDYYQQNCSIENIQESIVVADNLDITDSHINKMQFTSNENKRIKTECCIQSACDENTTMEKISENKNKETIQDDMPMPVDDRTINNKSLTYSQDSDDITIPSPCNDLVDEKYGNKDEKNGAPVKRKRGKGRRKLWKFLFELLEEDTSEEYVRWTNKEKGEFRMIKTSAVAALWGNSNNRKGMTYEKMTRAMRYYYKLKVIKKVPRKNLHYQFGTPIMNIVNVQEIYCTNKELAKKSKDVKEKSTATKKEEPANIPDANNKSCNKTKIEKVDIDIDMSEKTESLKNNQQIPCDIDNFVNNTSMESTLNSKQKLEESISDGIESDFRIIGKRLVENKLQTKRCQQTPIYFNAESYFRDLNYSHKFQLEINKDIQRACKTKIIYPHMISAIFS